MKRKLLSIVSLLVLLTTISSCTQTSQRDYLNELEVRRLIEQAIRENNQNLEFTQWEIVNVEVRENNWTWNSELGQWEAFVDLPELTEFIYENGAALGYVFIGTRGEDEVQMILPYDKFHYVLDQSGNEIQIKESVRCDFQYGSPSTVGFFIQTSWLSEIIKDESAPNNYNFRIVLIW